MAAIQKYLQKLSTTQLQALLREECEGRGTLPLETILDICNILAERNPQYPAAKDIILQLAVHIWNES